MTQNQFSLRDWHFLVALFPITWHVVAPVHLLGQDRVECCPAFGVSAGYRVADGLGEQRSLSCFHHSGSIIRRLRDRGDGGR